MKKWVIRLIKSLSFLIVLMIFDNIYRYYGNNWIFLKVRDKVYVANSLEIYDDINLGQIGSTQGTSFYPIRPIKNYTSNVLPYGIPIHAGINEDELYLDLNFGYIKMISTESKDWKLGEKVKRSDLIH